MNARLPLLICLGLGAAGLGIWLAGAIAAGDGAPPPAAARPAAATVAGPRWFSSVPAPGAANPGPGMLADRKTTVYGRNGRIIDLGGLSIAQYIGIRIAAARSGDTKAAYDVYQAESVCAANDDPEADYHDPAELAAFQRERKELAALCAGMSPAQVQERLGFLNLAARSGNKAAQIDVYMEGPYGRSVDLTQNPDDPIVKQWKDEALAYLKQAGDQCDHFALALLSTVYDAGQITARDVRTSMAYSIAAAIPRKKPVTQEQLRDRFGEELSGDDFSDALALGEQLGKQACPARP
ncbi:hypothetical protein [Massilia antarctica]|uniref:hypothetical protein n=1 Tax=Massilia antarctica TaxID=2765360 RepID=UPI0006BB603D|nr:hypothetical protein [Massilia sp. H27-R4]MCY0914210.1 hypothetical protein [Massilia sp. H27-R4]CUI08617.1 hypothetical protein BN2497_12011 [Janthinobacterium sp. CG23_2]CUU32403.1 hypothetical protein BN3177_12011 [Janthinobacterium sp. CG23_2]